MAPLELLEGAHEHVLVALAHGPPLGPFRRLHLDVVPVHSLDRHPHREVVHEDADLRILMGVRGVTVQQIWIRNRQKADNLSHKKAENPTLDPDPGPES